MFYYFNLSHNEQKIPHELMNNSVDLVKKSIRLQIAHLKGHIISVHLSRSQMQIATFK